MSTEHILYANHFVIQYHPVDGYVLTLSQLSQDPMKEPSEPAVLTVVGRFAIPTQRLPELERLASTERELREKEANGAPA